MSTYDSLDKFLARQPVFDRAISVCAYEILYRSSLEEMFGASSSGDTTAQVLADGTLLDHLDALTAGRRMFLECSRETMLSGKTSMLNPKNVIIEVPAYVDADDDFVHHCRRLKAQGFRIALNDFNERATPNDLILLADILKLDFQVASRSEIRDLVHKYIPRGVHLLANRLDTHEAFESARSFGFTQFQGDFFARPLVYGSKDVPAFKLTLLRVLQATSRENMNLDEVERLIRQDPALTYKMLRYVNSAWFGARSQIDSVRHMIMMLGENELRKWSTLVLLTALSGDKPPELSVLASVRARFCELLAPRAGLADSSEHLFLAGLMSTMDAILDRSMENVLKDLPLAPPVVNALRDASTPEGAVFAMVRAYESGDWMHAADVAQRSGIAPDELMAMYLDAVRWAAGALSGTNVGARAA